MRVAPPETPARSGVLYRLGLKSDLTDLSIGSAGTLWIVTSGDRAELLQGPVVFRPASGPAGGASETAFQIQAGAFSQEDPARKAADRLSSELGVAGQVAFAPDRGLYRVLLGSFPTRAEADAFLEKLKGRGQDGFVVAGAARPPEPAAGAAPRGRRHDHGDRHRGRAADARVARGPLRSGSGSPRRGGRRSVPGKPARPRESPRNAQRRQPRRPRGLSLRRRARGDGAEALRRDRGAESAGRGGADLRPGPPRPVRGRGLRHLPGSQVSGVRRRVGRGSAFDRGGRRHARPRPRPRRPVRRRPLRFDLRRRHGKRRERLLRRAGAVPRLGRMRRASGRGGLGLAGAARCLRAADVARMAGLRSAPSRAEESRGAGRESGGRAEARGGAQAGGAARAADALRGLSVARQRLRADGSPSGPADGARRGVLRRAPLRRRAASPARLGRPTSSCCASASPGTRSRRRTASSRRRSTAGSRSRSRSARSA